MENKLLSKEKSVFKTPSKMMKTAVITSPATIEIHNALIPEPAADEVRIKMQGCGICGSDLPVWEGRKWFDYPRRIGAPGHEGFGIIETVGKNVKNVKEGDRVAALSYHAYAEYDVAKADQVIRLPEFLDGTAFPGEPLGCAMNIFHRSDITKNDIVAVIGAGFIGNLLIQLAKSTSAKVIAISRRETSLNKAFESGADFVIRMDDHNHIVKRINELTGAAGCTRVIEATGKQWPLDLAGDIVSERGKIIIAGFHRDGTRQVNIQNWNWKGIDIVNAHERDPKEYCKGIQNAIGAIKAGILKPDLLYSHYFHLDDLDSAFQKMVSREQGFMKAIVLM